VDSNLIALVTPGARPMPVPNVDPNCIKPLDDLIEREIIARSRTLTGRFSKDFCRSAFPRAARSSLFALPLFT